MEKGAHELDYETPAAAVPPPKLDCFADGTKYLILREGTATPDRCVRCNAPAGGFLISRTFRPPLMAEGGLFYPLLIVAQLVTRRSMEVRLALCSACRARRARSMSRAAVVIAASSILIALGVLRLATADPGSAAPQLGLILVLLGFVALVLSVRSRSGARNVLRFHAMGGEQLALKGAGKAFLASLTTPTLRTASVTRREGP
jgi:hypothetical protein